MNNTQNVNKEHLSFENNINPERIFNWTVDLHNEVNKMHHKKVWSYDEARNFYTRFNQLAQSKIKERITVALCCNKTFVQTKLQKLLVEML